MAAALQAQPLDADDARFLLTRTGFAPSPSEVSSYEGLTRQQAVDKLLEQAVAQPVTPAPSWVEQPFVPYRQFKDKSDEERKAHLEKEIRQGFDLRGWWLREMLATPSPLTERMTLFWHNHFVSSQQKVKYSQLMYRQNMLLRRHALGNFGAMLHAASKDPAMLIYLDNAGNRKGAPNENFAREVMELFTLGEGHYAEQDIKEAARAFTGWSIEPDTGEFRWRPFIHDDGMKTVLGRSGNFEGDAALDILLAQPACAEYIVTKLWREFVSPNPDADEVAHIARRFHDSHYEIKVALHELFLSRAFWDAKNRATLVKSPVEMMVGALKQFQFNYDDPLPFTFAVAQLGQNLFSPPNVKGWPGGEDWINSTTLLARKSILERLFRATEADRKKDVNLISMAGMPAVETMKSAREQMNESGKVKGRQALGRAGRIQFANAASMISFDPDAWLGQFGATAGTAPDVTQRLAIQKAVLPLEPTAPIRADLTGAAYLRTLLMDPVYQLK
ncbi:MAG: uncharacterized protein JWQ21_2418 [Herminiimonas sp.]|nr:uncharacterized protein [Herminiimonas sp.]